MGSRPLDGVTVLDLGQIYQGPYATLLLARAGARVFKIEPRTGDPLRRREMAGEGPSYTLAFLNSDKLGVTLDLKRPEGRELLIEMARRADVLLENFAPGVLDRLGVGASMLMEINPRLVYASGTGFGLSGPDHDRVAMDPTVQASSGVMSINGEADGPPLRVGPAVADFMGGTHLYGAVVTALFERERTGRGRMVEVSMQEAVFPTLASDLGLYHLNGGHLQLRRGNRHGGVAPYNVYETRDGWLALICVTERHWELLCEAMGRPELRDDPRFATNASRVENIDAVDEVVAAWARGLARDEAWRVASEHRVPCAPVRDLAEVLVDPHMHERGMLQWVEHPTLGRVVLPSSPIRVHGAATPPLRPSPAIGEHNREVYGDWLGLSEERIADLEADGVI
ncbi:MAG: CoA transferase [Thermoanaerobaculia bacterium]|nr:CoA transferase [Thermoanaerobaculia bacterium]